MARFLRKNDSRKGRRPGVPVFLGEQKTDQVKTRIIDYDLDRIDEKDLEDIRDGASYRQSDTVSWINISGLHSPEFITEMGQVFNLHPLTLEDILNTGQRPKVEEFDDYLFVVMKMMHFDAESNMVVSDQFTIVIGDRFLLTFQEKPGTVFDPVRQRIRRQKSRIRGAGTDYLAYALMDAVVDNYITIIEMLGEKIEDLEEEVLSGENSQVMEQITIYKREINYLRKSVRPIKDAVFKLSRTESDLIREQTLPFLKDLEDLISKSADAIESYRDLLSDHLNIYNSVVANRMNDIMKVLTIFAAVFIPLTFVAGIYGTNFEYVPELKYRYSYFIFWGVLVVMAAGLLYFFKRKRWI